MVRILIKTISIFVLFAMACLSFSMPTFAVGSLEEQEKALNIIADFADRMCKDIPLRGKGNNLELTGSAKAELKGLISKIAKLGVEGAVKYQDTEYEGLLQKDLVRALEDSTDCRLQVWKDLKGSLLGPIKVTFPAPLDHCAEYGPPNSDYIQEITEQAQKDAGSQPYVTDLIRQTIPVGHFLTWVAACGKTQTAYERNIGNSRYIITPYAVYKDSGGKECREMAINKNVEGRWHGYSQIYCRVRGQWTISQGQ